MSKGEDREVLNVMSHTIIGCAVEVHRSLGGPGLLESVYEEALCYELGLKNCQIQRQQLLPLVYKGQTLSSTMRIDLMVNDLIIIECKAVTEYNKVYESQLLTYLRVSQKPLGLVINFGVAKVIEGIKRVINDF